jgi:hypothetical protein
MSTNASGTAQAAVYRVTPEGHFTVMHTFAGDAPPSPRLIALSNGDLFGTTKVFDGVAFRLTAFRLTTSGAFTVVRQLPDFFSILGGFRRKGQMATSTVLTCAPERCFGCRCRVISLCSISERTAHSVSAGHRPSVSHGATTGLCTG